MGLTMAKRDIFVSRSSACLSVCAHKGLYETGLDVLETPYEFRLKREETLQFRLKVLLWVETGAYAGGMG
jgi:hypothetical protein